MKKQVINRTFLAIAAFAVMLLFSITIKAQTKEAYAVMDTTAKRLSFFYNSKLVGGINLMHI